MEESEFIPVITDGKIADEAGKVYDLTRTIDGSISAYLSAGIIIALIAVILLEIRAMKKNGGKFVPFILGVLAYFYFGVLIYGIIAILVNQIPGMGQFAVDHEIQRIVFIMALTAVLIVFGKAFSIYLIRNRYDTIGDALSFATGFALGNILPTLANWFMTTTVITAINEAGGLIGVFEGASAEDMLSYAKQYESLFSLNGNDIMYQGLFIVLTIAFNIYTIVFMYAIRINKMSFYMNWGIYGVHFALLLINALGTYGYMDQMVAFVINALIVIASLRYIFITSKFKLGDLLKPVEQKVVVDKSKYKPKMMKSATKKKKK